MQDVTATVPNVELMRCGTFALSTGMTSFSSADLASAVAASACPAVRNPVLKLGHVDPRFDGEPALGWVSGLRTSGAGTVLSGDLSGVPVWLKSVMASAYPDRSIEGFRNFPCAQGHTHPFVVSAVALLGVTAPGIGSLKSLQDVAGLYGLAAAAESRGTRVVVRASARKEEAMSVGESPRAAAVLNWALRTGRITHDRRDEFAALHASHASSCEAILQVLAPAVSSQFAASAGEPFPAEGVVATAHEMLAARIDAAVAQAMGPALQSLGRVQTGIGQVKASAAPARAAAAPALAFKRPAVMMCGIDPSALAGVPPVAWNGLAENPNRGEVAAAILELSRSTGDAEDREEMALSYASNDDARAFYDAKAQADAVAASASMGPDDEDFLERLAAHDKQGRPAR